MVFESTANLTDCLHHHFHLVYRRLFKRHGFRIVRRTQRLIFWNSVDTLLIIIWLDMEMSTGCAEISKNSSINLRLSDNIKVGGYGHLVQNTSLNNHRRCATLSCTLLLKFPHNAESVV